MSLKRLARQEIIFKFLARVGVLRSKVTMDEQWFERDAQWARIRSKCAKNNELISVITTL